MKYKIKNNFVLKCFTYSSLVYLFFAIVFLTVTCINTYNIVNTYEKLEGVYSENYISFVDGDNQEYHIEETSNIFEENEEVIVYLHKTDKTKVHYHKILFNDIYNFIMIGAVILLAYVILQVILSIKSKRERYIIKNGKKVTGRIIEIVRKKDNEGNYLYLKCEYDPIFDHLYYFSSQKIFNNKIYKSKYTGGTATIYYLPEDTGSYVITDCNLK